jgi:hypothetical protein
VGPYLKSKPERWYTPVVPATQEEEIGGSQSEVSPVSEILSEKQTEEQKGWEHGSSGRAPV